jgi:pilus assembly protein Flp/PilA
LRRTFTNETAQVPATSTVQATAPQRARSVTATTAGTANNTSIPGAGFAFPICRPSGFARGQPNPLDQEFIMLSLIATLQTLGFNLKGRLHEEKGATAVEYGIMVGLIAVVIIVAVATLGGQLNSMFTNVTANL